jgi:hypothetical protein
MCDIPRRSEPNDVIGMLDVKLNTVLKPEIIQLREQTEVNEDPDIVDEANNDQRVEDIAQKVATDMSEHHSNRSDEHIDENEIFQLLTDAKATSVKHMDAQNTSTLEQISYEGEQFANKESLQTYIPVVKRKHKTERQGRKERLQNKSRI